MVQSGLTCQTKGNVLISVMIKAKIVSFHANGICRTSTRHIVRSEGRS